MKSIISIILLFALATSASTQCFPDRHSTSWFDAWVSCEKASNPNPSHPESHWILYDLGQAFELGQAHFWNYNDPSFLDRGIQKALVDISSDGFNWYTLDTLYLTRGEGIPTYEGEEAYDFDGEAARFVLITIVETYGDGECAGFSELRVERSALTTAVEDESKDQCLVVNTYPNPYVESSLITVHSDCADEATWSIVNVMGQVIHSGNLTLSNSVGTIMIGDNLKAGRYVVNVQIGDLVKSEIITRIE